MTKADEYLRHADECLKLAEQNPVPEQRAWLLRMADEWRRLAANMESKPKAET